MNCFLWWGHRWSKWERVPGTRVHGSYSGWKKNNDEYVGHTDQRTCRQCGRRTTRFHEKSYSKYGSTPETQRSRRIWEADYLVKTGQLREDERATWVAGQQLERTGQSFFTMPGRRR